MKTMHGTVGVYHFDQMVKDTIEAHGIIWAYDYYVMKHGLSDWEWNIFSGSTTCVVSMGLELTLMN